MIREISKLSVYYHDRLVGMIAISPKGNCVFQYDKEWLTDGFSISPLKLPLTNQLFEAPSTPFYGNFGVFADSLPDGYGRYLLHKMLLKEGIDDFTLNPLQRLSIVGSSGMGALCYLPETAVGISKELPSLDSLQQLADDVLNEKSLDNIDILYHNSGNSGGCRPKCLLNVDGESWLIKFRHTYDPLDMGQKEYQYSLTAKACGINMPETRLFEGKYFGVKRFDIDNGQRIHTITAAGLLDVDFRYPSLDYIALMQATGYLTKQQPQVEEMFRRMVFNVLTGNKDDHAKNIAFLYINNGWQLSPAYDLTRSDEGYGGEHTTLINGKGLPDYNDMIEAGTRIRLPRKKCKELFDQVHSNCAKIMLKKWHDF